MGNERPRYWFPLALLGFAQLAVVALSVGSHRSEGWFAYVPHGDGGMFGPVQSAGTPLTAVSAGAIGRMDNWLFAVFAVYLGTVLFYALRTKTMR
ncbi:hypothetical protein [Amycolatopsis sp. SB7-3]|uniref:hypothetical protein n=1 Tax=Amycolatopsis sp. SB7-3 TaxID=3373438 RepID=UPI003742B5E4